MPNLVCSVENCAYNNEYLCSLNEIHVDGSHAEDPHSTFCGSFCDQKESFSNCEHCGCATKNTEIDCEAENCAYNDSNRCHADGIDVCGCGSNTARGTECSTFRLKY
ncbi:MAG: DUF1540 domain-containing protein [bacterium]|nr:DUF1540 domain-containing protein [bacterium]